jgi:hypothetical protein
MGDNDGYGYDPAALTDIAGRLRATSDQLMQVASKQITAPDAGASSGAVGQALADLVGAAFGASAVVESSAENVHTANGSYSTTENNHKGELSREMDKGMEDYPDVTEMNVPLN